jgi:hypothetical protein
MYLGDPSGPISRERTPQRLRFSGAVRGILDRIFDQEMNPLQIPAIALEPMLIVLPALRRED